MAFLPPPFALVLFNGISSGLGFVLFLIQGPYSPDKLRAHYADQIGLKLKSSACFCFQSVLIKGMHHHTQLPFCFGETGLVSSPCWPPELGL